MRKKRVRTNELLNFFSWKITPLNEPFNCYCIKRNDCGRHFEDAILKMMKYCKLKIAVQWLFNKEIVTVDYREFLLWNDLFSRLWW